MYLVVFVSVTSITITEGFGNHSESLLLFLFHGTEFRDVFSSAEGFGTEFRDFLFRGTAGIPSEITICSVFSVFRGIIFLSEIPNPSPYTAAHAISVHARGALTHVRFYP